jgi:AAA+ ATPase superfamily predicted ATPase
VVTDLVDREHEQRELRALLDEGTPHLALLYGRRRVGKTYLLTHSWPAERTLYWTASATTPAQNREQLIRDVAAWSGQELRPEDYPTWRTVFRLLLDLRAPQPLVVVLDEFQYLGEDPRELAGVASELNAAWEQRRPLRALVFVISGSAIRTLEALDAGGAPLHGRFAWKAELRPFNYWYAAQMAAFRSLRDRARAYGIFGGTPRYLAAVKPSRSLAENAARLALAPRGEVRGLIETAILQEQGLRDIPKYQAILRAIGGGGTELNEIGQRAGLPSDTTLRDKVERLVGLEYVRPYRNLGAVTTMPFRYRIADPAFAFYYEFVTRYQAALERSEAAQIWRQAIAPQLDAYLGHVFEQMAEQAYHRLQTRLHLPVVMEWGRWEGKDRAGHSLELDIAATLTDGRVLTGAVKWNARPLDRKWHFHHLETLDRLAHSGVKWAHAAKNPEAPLLYVAAGGFTEAFEEAARASRDQVYLWTLRDLYKAGSGGPAIRTT